MANIQTLLLQRKKYALLPMGEYEKLLAHIEDLEDLAEIKKRAKEPRHSLEEVKKNYLRKNKRSAL